MRPPPPFLLACSLISARSLAPQPTVHLRGLFPAASEAVPIPLLASSVPKDRPPSARGVLVHAHPTLIGPDQLACAVLYRSLRFESSKTRGLISNMVHQIQECSPLPLPFPCSFVLPCLHLLLMPCQPHFFFPASTTSHRCLGLRSAFTDTGRGFMRTVGWRRIEIFHLKIL